MQQYIREFSTQFKKSADRLMNYFLVVFFAIGLLLAFYYDTWLIAIGIGGVSLIAYYSSKLLLPASDLYQYVLSAVVGIFMAQYIYQMHGMFEMHFFAFIGSAIMITYRNWKLQIPLSIVVVLHHSVFGYMQFRGFEKIYFTQLEYMPIQTFIIHAVLTVIIFSLCGLWAYNFKKADERNIEKSFEIGKLQEAYKQREAFIAISEDLGASNKRLKEAKDELEKIFNTVEEVLFSVDLVNFRVIEMSIACKKVYGFDPIEFIADNELWKKMIYPDDRYLIDGIDEILATGKTWMSQYRIIHRDKSIRWIDTKVIPTINKDGMLVRIDGMHTDVTEKVRLMNKLYEEKKRSQQEMTAAVITAQENERTFLGEELHDNINPILATAKLYVDCAISEEENRINLLKDSKGFISTAMEEIRTLSRSLIQPSLEEIGLRYAISDIISNIEKVNELRFTPVWNNLNEEMLSENLKLTIYRIFQEQVNNIIKHAQARTVHVEFVQRGSELQFCIKDDGVGFEVSQKRNGVGLKNIISRTELYNGKAVVNSKPGHGCELIISFHTDKAEDSISITRRIRA